MFRSVQKFSAALFVGLLLTGSAKAQSPDPITSAPLQISSFATLRNHAVLEKNLEAKTRYPQFRAKTPLTRYVNWRVRTDATKYLRGFVTQARNDLKEFTPPGAMAYDESFGLHFYEPNRLISLARSLYTYGGGAHGNYGTYGVSYGVPKGEKRPRVLVLGDFFRKGSDYQNHVDKALVQKLRAKTNPEASWVRDGQIKTLKPQMIRNFVVERDGLRWFFPPYAVGPYVVGQFEVKLSKAELGPDFREFGK